MATKKSPSPAARSPRKKAPPKAKPQANGPSSRKPSKAAPAPDGAEKSWSPALPFPVVGIGASAGGCEALVSVLKHLPANTGMGFIVIMHLDPHYKSKLTEILARATTMAVREIRDGLAVEPNTLYILPSNNDAVLSGNRLQLLRRPENERLHLPIDRFFSSLAQHQRDRAIGVILSGTGSDGTAGLGEIKAEAGIALVEAESSAKYFGMPRSAVDSGCVDAVLTAEAIAGELARIARHPLLHPRAKATASDPFPESADALAKIFFLLKQNSSVDFSLYKSTTLRRRIARRMVLQRLERVEDYIKLLRSHHEELNALFHDLLINVTGFFRDKKVFATLKKKVIPRLLKAKREGSEVRVWVPGCATGEEAYSLAICLIEEIDRSARNLRLQIFGTDLSEAVITKARHGVYPASITRDVSPERLRRFFTKSGGGYQISRHIRDTCTFARQNLCEDPPFSRLDLISCRNVLIYLGPELQKRCLPVFHYALAPQGFLLLGTAETVGESADLFTLVDKQHKIYAKKNGAVAPRLEFSGRGAPAERPETAVKPGSGKPDRPLHGPIDLHAQADRIILSQYAPSGVIIDGQMRVHEFRGSTGSFLEHAPGTATLNLLQMVRGSLVADLRAAIYQSQKEQALVRKEGVPLTVNGHTREIAIAVLPFRIAHSTDKWQLVLFDDSRAAAGGSARAEKAGAAPRRATARPDGPDKEIDRLSSELDAKKESLRTIIEEQEATNEELKSANEEIEASNEELQSTNEELEMAKEELQSTNEELTTLNEELSNRNLEMAQVNNDLTNFLGSINIPIIMVDNNLLVRRATSLAEKFFNLIPADIGRRLSDLKDNLNITDIDAMIHDVLDSLVTRETKVQDKQGRWHSLRIRPYRTRDNKIDGAVITLIDIDDVQRSVARLELVSQYTEALLETVREPVVVLDPDFRVERASRAFYEAFGLTHKKTVGMHFCEIGRGEWNAKQIRTMLEETLSKEKPVADFAVELNFRKLGVRKLVFNARLVEHKGESAVLLAIEDVTEGRSRIG